MSVLLQDLRHALRSLGRSPGYAAVAVLTLALGIGANATIFSLVNGVLFKPPVGVVDAGRVVAIYTSDYSSGPYGNTSYPDYEAVRADTAAFSSVAAYTIQRMALSVGDRSELVVGQGVSGNFFATLGTLPSAGRLLIPSDAREPGAEAVAVISHGFWLRRFGADPAVAGREIRVNGRAFRVVGVAPPGFTGLLRGVVTDVWVPATMGPVLQPGSDDLSNIGSRAFFMAARLRPGVSSARASARLAAVARARFEQYPDQWATVSGAPRQLTLLPEAETRVPPQGRGVSLGAATILLVAVGLVLLIACANMANLLLARANRRRREMAVRASLGASRRQLAGHVLAESLLLTIMGASLGLALASWITAAAGTITLPGLPVAISLDLGVDGRVLAFTAVVSLLTAAAFGLVPALRASRPDLLTDLKAEVGMFGRGRRISLRNALVVGQIAVSVVLLVTAGLFLRSLGRAGSADPGFDPSNTAVMSFDLESSGFARAQGRAFYDALLQHVRALPGVRSATLASSIPLADCCSRRGTGIQGYVARPGESTEINWNVVATDYFRTLRIPLVRGRDFDERDRDGSPPVVIVNEAFAQRYWPGQPALGRHVFLEGPDGPASEVVGVVRNGRYRSLGEEPLPFLYAPLAQQYRPAVALQVRTTADAAAVLPLLRAQVHELAPALPVIRPTTMRDALGIALLPQRLGAVLLGALGAIAGLLAALGLYGVVAYSVAQRTREFGIRAALGADRRRLLRQVIGEAMALSGAGALIGLALATAATRVLASFLFGVSPFDPAAYGAVLLLLGGITVAASYLPARRATEIDPVRAMRAE